MKSALPKIVGALLNSIGVFNSKLASRLALQVFSKPRKGKLTPNANSFLDTATKSTLYYTGFPIQPCATEASLNFLSRRMCLIGS